MWLSEQMKFGGEFVPAAAEVGQVSLGGASLAVVTQGERRELALALPGGFKWRPKLGQQVLVLKSAEGESIVIGTIPTEKDSLQPGELEIKGTGSSIKLSGGRIVIDGELVINGESYKPCSCTGVI